MDKDKKKVIEIMQDFCEQYNHELRDDYSGRRMYGDTCVGIVCDYPLEVLVELCQYLADNDIDDFHEYLSGVRQDSMGMENIIYFPELGN